MGAPLFFDDRDHILTYIRMGGMCADAAGQALVDRALLTVRIGILEALGTGRVASLQALTFTEEPSTSAELERAKVQIAEAEWLHGELLHVMPTLLLEGGSLGHNSYQDEQPFRLMDQTARSEMAEQLIQRAQTALRELGGSSKSSTFRMDVVGPDSSKGESPDVTTLLDNPYSLGGSANYNC